jgi:GNAT superfamily N-acetyltransferase
MEMTPTGLLIRPFEPRDQAAARRLILHGLGEHFGYIDETLNRDLDDIASSYLALGHLVVVATGGGVLVGTGALVGEGERVGRLVRMSVRRSSRRQGVGRALVHRLVAEARQRAYVRLLVETNASWDDAVGLYRSCGFVEHTRTEGLVELALDLD